MPRTNPIVQKDMTLEQLEMGLSPKEKEFFERVTAGGYDPVYFAEVLLGVPTHPKQKLWLWLTTKTQKEKAFQLGLQLLCWKTRPEFDEKFLNHDFLFLQIYL